MTHIGHNNGPTLEKGRGWRLHTWKRARADLVPTLPLNVARRRVKRAAELGIDYKSYAGIRAATGRDIIALIFSSNALRILRETSRIDATRAKALAQIHGADRLALVQPPLVPATIAKANPILAAAARAPGLTHTFGETRATILALTGKRPADGVVVIGETALERDWVASARLAGYLPAERYFSATS